MWKLVKDKQNINSGMYRKGKVTMEWGKESVNKLSRQAIKAS